MLDAASAANESGTKSELYRKLYLAEGELKKVIRKESPSRPPLVFWFYVLKYYSAAALSFLIIGVIVTLTVLNNIKGNQGALVTASDLDNSKYIAALDKQFLLAESTQPELQVIRPVEPKPALQKSMSANNTQKQSSKHLARSSNSPKNDIPVPAEATAAPPAATGRSSSKGEVLASMRREDSDDVQTRQTSSKDEPSGNTRSAKKINSLKLLLEIEENLNSENK